MVRTLSTPLLLAVLVLTFVAAGCSGGGNDTTGPGSILDPAMLVPEVQVQNVDHGFRVAGWTDDNQDSDPIFSLIGSANSSLDIAVTRINRQDVVESLLREANSGTNIRIVTEKAYYDDPSYAPFYDQLEDPAKNGGNIEIQTDLEGLPRTMHDRFMVIDNSRVVTGSYNWEATASDHTFGDVISILNTEVAAAFENQFNQMFIEHNFGVNKRNDTQHTFLLGSGNGILEVYFGPTDRPRDLLLGEISASQNVMVAVQQFKDVTVAGTLLGWLDASADNSLYMAVNDIGPLGDQEENAVYDAFTSYITDPTGGSLYHNGLIDQISGQFNQFDTLNHKMVFVDRSRIGAEPSIITMTSNFSEMGFTLNDETMLIMRGVPMVYKFWRAADLTGDLPPAAVDDAGDFQEFDQLLAMYPMDVSAGADPIRAFDALPSGIVFGTVDNFRPTVTITSQDGQTTQDIDIDLRFDIRGDLYFGSSIQQVYGLATDQDTVPVVLEDHPFFVRSELLNPDHKYMFIVPAGQITIVTTVTDLAGAVQPLFEPSEKTIYIAPGGVKEVKLQINQQNPNAGGAGTSG